MEPQRRLDRRIGAVLRAGVAASLVIILAGLILAILWQIQSPTALMTVSSLPAELARLNPLALITGGILLVLILPPVVVALALAYYISIRDRRMVIICCVLLAVMLASFIYSLK